MTKRKYFLEYEYWLAISFENLWDVLKFAEEN
jgi:hypothetical protein